MKYRFLGQPDKAFPNVIYGETYSLTVRTSFWSGKPIIFKPFYCPYSSWMAFYRNWRPMTIGMFKLEKRLVIDKETRKS